MPIPEPPNTDRFWELVKSQSGWPDTDEDGVRELSEAWGQASRMFAAPARISTAPVRAAWPDRAGEAFADAVDVLRDRADQIELSARQEQYYTANLAGVVTNAKTLITDAVVRRIPAFGQAYRDGSPAAAQLLLDAVTEVRTILETAAELIRKQDSGVALQGVPGAEGAEYQVVTDFITDEITRNAQSQTVAELREANASFPPAALHRWFGLVLPGGDWDHKEDILDITAGDNRLTPIPGTDTGITYEFWSNLHYGYVGTEAAFPDWALHAGADAEDVVSEGGPDPRDQAAIQIGIELHQRYRPEEITPEIIQQTIEDHRDELTELGVIRPLDHLER